LSNVSKLEVRSDIGMLTIGNENVAKEATTVVGPRDLGDEHRSNASQCASPDASEHTRTNDEVEVLRSRLQSPANQTKEGGVEKAIDTADAICNPAAQEASEDGAKIVATDNPALLCCISDRAVCSTDADGYYVVGRCIDLGERQSSVQVGK